MDSGDGSATTSPGYSIGALARAVDIPIPTLRTWESRYGYPRADRLPSGHRRFPADTVPRLRLVRRLLELGHAPSAVVAAELEALRGLLGGDLPAAPARPAPPADDRFADWFDAVERFDVRALEAHLEEGWNAVGALGFLEGALSGFLYEEGLRWRAGRLDVAREHLASASIGLFLSRHWRAMSDVATGPVAVCAALPGEHHELGLHMAAVAVALAGWRIRFLGADTPVAAIASAAAELRAHAVVLSASQAAAPDQVRAALVDLRARLPAEQVVWFGGIPPVEREGLATWPESLTALTRAARARAHGSPV